MTDDVNGRTRIQELTHRAFTAALAGRWDLVDQCYRERESQFGGAPLSMEEQQRLLALDRQVQEQATVVHKVLASILQDAVMHRQRLMALRRRLGATIVESGTILLQA
jgi:hypothetical protein